MVPAYLRNLLISRSRLEKARVMTPCVMCHVSHVITPCVMCHVSGVMTHDTLSVPIPGNAIRRVSFGNEGRMTPQIRMFHHLHYTGHIPVLEGLILSQRRHNHT